MGEHSSRKKKHKLEESATSSSQSSSESDDEIDSSSDDESRRKRRHKRRRREEERSRRSSSRSHKHREREKREKKHRKKRKHRGSSSNRRSKREGKRKYPDSDESDSGSGSGSDDSPSERLRERPEDVVKGILQEFPTVAGDLEQLLQMIDDGQAVDIRGLSEKLLVKRLRKLFLSLNLKESGDHVFLLPSKASPTLETIGPLIRSQMQLKSQEFCQNDEHSKPLDSGGGQESYNANMSLPNEEASAHNVNLSLPNDNATAYDANLSLPAEEGTGPKRRVIGPAIPSAELLAAAAKLTEAQAELRDVELEEDTELFVGPPPPALVTEVESANEAERFEEVTRIMGAEADNLYDVLGVNRNMLGDNIKKRYWKLSLMVHPDKCSHPEAHQAFIKLNKAFKDLQDPDKRKVLDDKIKHKEEQEELKADLQAMREAALWRRVQGISMEGDDLLLAEMEVKAAPKRDEWMTTLPPERKAGVTMQSTTSFSKSSKEGRGDTSAWTDTPSDRAQKAKMNYLEAFNEASALASKEQEKSRASVDAELVEQYNKAKRSKSMVEKHQETVRAKSKKKSKQESMKEEWEGNHPWKPWDRDKDLTAGRQNVKLEAADMAQGLTSRFSSGSFQRNFL
ncbi:PREDICTED: uncharacterized protein LOC109215170 [Nicotiana attenuata]|uniref:J domain-containing protein n=1 Tax=Nicotiana attenuata TaxID=49451 RepID=A0A1J6IRS5_NICAT|nr:PREDICTED: uncharacterized protein LOC109215170 [Nicotiana attenuata]OIT06940.1 hypothetical protein A4A49_32836 [Nicotiana attenuata]